MNSKRNWFYLLFYIRAMKRLIIISLLIIACSKGEEKVEEEDNRPLIED